MVMGRAGFNLKVKSELFNTLRIKLITKASWTKYTDAFYLVLSEVPSVARNLGGVL